MVQGDLLPMTDPELRAIAHATSDLVSTRVAPLENRLGPIETRLERVEHALDLVPSAAWPRVVMEAQFLDAEPVTLAMLVQMGADLRRQIVSIAESVADEYGVPAAIFYAWLAAERPLHHLFQVLSQTAVS